MIDFDGSHEEFRQMLSKASQDEELARSVRRRLNYKRSQTGKVISTATGNFKFLKPKELSRSHKYGVDTNSTIGQIDRDMSLHGCHVVGVQEPCIKR